MSTLSQESPAEELTVSRGAGQHGSPVPPQPAPAAAGPGAVVPGAVVPGAVAVDGRTLRAQRTRDAVVEALLALQEEGDLAPTAQRVAARAGVALRTVYGHFSDMEALWLEAGRRELAKIGALADIPSCDRPFAERLSRFAASRARVLETLLPVMRAARLRKPFSEQLRRNWSMYVEVGDEEARLVFRPELDAAGTARDELLHALYLLAGGPAWDALRDDRRLAPEQAEAVLRESVRGLLAPYLEPVTSPA